VSEADELALRLRAAAEAARAGGAVHLRLRGGDLQRDVHAGERADYSTEADREAQAAVREALRRYFPDEPLVGEETEMDWAPFPSLLQSGCWLTDPLDGTLEFVHGTPAFSCVVSFVREGRPLAAAVYFPAWDELFSAARGAGARLNGRPVRVSGAVRLEEAVFAVPHRSTAPDRARHFADQLAKLVPHLEAFRISGPPSLMATWVACGRYDIMSFLSPRQEAVPGRPFLGQPWETAAFVLLVQEAGGAVASFGGGPPDLLGYNVYAASRALIDEFLAAVAA